MTKRLAYPGRTAPLEARPVHVRYVLRVNGGWLGMRGVTNDPQRAALYQNQFAATRRAIDTGYGDAVVVARVGAPSRRVPG